MEESQSSVALDQLLDSLPFTVEEREDVRRAAELSLQQQEGSNKELSRAFYSLPQVLARQAAMLAHSSRCLMRNPAKDLPCPVFPAHCSQSQALFFHMQSCSSSSNSSSKCSKCGVLKQYLMDCKNNNSAGGLAGALPPPPQDDSLLQDLTLPREIVENAQIVKKLKLAKSLLSSSSGGALSLSGVDLDQLAMLLHQKEQHGYFLQGELLKLCQGNKTKFNELMAACLEQHAQLQPKKPPPPPAQVQAPPPPPPPPPVALLTTKPPPAAPPARQKAPAAPPPPPPARSAASAPRPVVITAAAAVATSTSTPAPPPVAPKRPHPSSSSSSSSSSKRAHSLALQDKRRFPAVDWARRSLPFPQLSPDHIAGSFLALQSHQQVVQHLASLSHYQHKKEGAGQTNANSRNFDPTRNFRHLAGHLLRMLMELPFAHVFRHPVDPVALGLDMYFDIVKRPMDLGTIKHKLESKTTTAAAGAGTYTNLAEFAADVRLMFDNAIVYNTLDQDVGQIAAQYGAQFELAYYQLCSEEHDKFAEMRFPSTASSTSASPCNVCGHGEDFVFEPPVFVCDVCDNKIKRDSLMYVNHASGEHRVCRACFKDQPGSFLRFVPSPGAAEEKFSKSLFKEQKNNQLVREEWLMCFYCRRKSHAICGMAKTGPQQPTTKRDYMCPLCLLRFMEEKSFQQTDFNAFPVHINLDAKEAPTPRTAAELPTTELSRFIEQRLRERLATVTTGQSPGRLSVRMVLNKREELFTREGMLDLYGNAAQYGYPSSFPGRQKCLLLFEEIDGFDVLLFVMYVQYYGTDAPHPNKRSLYISYLDSVNYFSVKPLRTQVYQEIVISLLEFERQQGYVRCFIWSCPPASGDDYIFHVHPKTQRIPDAAKLRHWYFDLLEQARQRGQSVVSLNTLLDEYICRAPDVRFVPYFDGDWVNVYGEFFINNLKKKDINPLRRQNALEASKNTGTLLKLSEQEISMQKLANKQRKVRAASPSSSSSSPPGGGGGLAGDSAHEQCAAIRPLLQVPVQDVLTAKILAENEKMRKDFIVVKMCFECAQCSQQMDEPNVLYWHSPQYSAERDPHDYRYRTYAAPYCLCHPCYVEAFEGEYGHPPVFELPPLVVVPVDQAAAAAAEASVDVEFKFPVPAAQQQQHTPQRAGAAVAASPSSSSSSGGVVTRRKRNHGDDVADALLSSSSSSPVVVGGIEILPLGRKARPPNAYLTGQYSIDLKSMALVRANVRQSTVQDADADMECALFDQRRGFVSKCQDRKWQFDELRRAKHSTQSLLEMLHQPHDDDDDGAGGAGEHALRCCQCQSELRNEYYTCNGGSSNSEAAPAAAAVAACDGYDVCVKCHSSSAQQHPHPLVLVRALELKSALAVLDHIKQKGTSCSPGGSSSDGCDYCGKVRRLFAHYEKCALREAGGCGGCKRFTYLLTGHAKLCRDPHCSLPHCARLKRQRRRLQEGANDRRVMSMGREATEGQSAASAAAGGTAAAAAAGGTAAAAAAAAAMTE